MGASIFFSFITLFSLLTILQAVRALPLSTSSRWIVDEGGKRVKLSCVNWANHLEPVVAEGLNKQPLDAISKKIVSLGFNCVRLTWPLYLATNDTLASLTVRQSFQSLGLTDAISGVERNNPKIIDLSLIEALQAVVKNLGDNNVMVILDNHISKPGWCCSDIDGNGFFNDQYFNPDLWIQGLTRIASLFNGVSNVIGISLRNELRGPGSNVDDWYTYMQKGAEAVHKANPKVLVFLSGLKSDKNLSFLRKRPLKLSFSGKVVFEIHWYAFSDGVAWQSRYPNLVCSIVVNNLMKQAGFLLNEGWPLIVTEFGVDQRGTNLNDNRYLDCFLATASKLDLDWAVWTLVGSYYLREGVVEMEEFYGILNKDWNGHLRDDDGVKTVKLFVKQNTVKGWRSCSPDYTMMLKSAKIFF
ncbi:hypothetical protein UlMin_040152 [Ulmus minor]